MNIFKKFAGSKDSKSETVSKISYSETSSNKDEIVRHASKRVAEFVKNKFGFLSPVISFRNIDVMAQTESPVDCREAIIRKAALAFEVVNAREQKPKKYIASVMYNIDDEDDYRVGESLYGEKNKKIASKQDLSASEETDMTLRKAVMWNPENDELEVLGNHSYDLERNLRQAKIHFENRYENGPICEIFADDDKVADVRKLFAQMAPVAPAVAPTTTQPDIAPVQIDEQAKAIEPATKFDVNSATLSTALEINKGNGDTWTIIVRGGGSNMLKNQLNNKSFTYYNLKKTLVDAGLVDAANMLDNSITDYLQKEVIDGTVATEAQATVGENLENFPGTVTASQEVIKENEEPVKTPEKNDVVDENVNPVETPKNMDVIDENLDPVKTPKNAGEPIKENSEKGFDNATAKAKVMARKAQVLQDWNDNKITDEWAGQQFEEIEEEERRLAQMEMLEVKLDKNSIPEVPKEEGPVVETEKELAKTPEDSEVIESNEDPVKTPENTKNITDGDSGKLPKSTKEAKKKVSACIIEKMDGVLEELDEMLEDSDDEEIEVIEKLKNRAEKMRDMAEFLANIRRMHGKVYNEERIASERNAYIGELNEAYTDVIPAPLKNMMLKYNDYVFTDPIKAQMFGKRILEFFVKDFPNSYEKVKANILSGKLL